MNRLPDNIVYEVVSATGTLIEAFYDRKRALAFAEGRSARVPGLQVYQVHRWQVSHIVWRERMPRLVEGGR